MMMMAMTTINSIRVNPLLFTASSLEVVVGCPPAPEPFDSRQGALLAGSHYVHAVDCDFE